MCGIMAYIGKQEAYPILLDGLKKLEYRGYDSSGVALMNGSLSLLKKEGNVSALEAFAKAEKTDGNIGLGHTRWATHGVPSDLNAHPHQSQSGRYTIVHNGIIENHDVLRNMLKNQGFEFQSDTDTEVLVQLIDWHQQKFQIDTRNALARALDLVDGSFAVVLFDLKNPTKLWGAKRQSPLVLGLGKNECFLSSDTLPLAQYVDQVIHIQDDTIVEMRDDGQYAFYNLELQIISLTITRITKSAVASSKGNYDSYMLKEIYEQPLAVRRVLGNNTSHKLPDDIDRIIIVACGTSWHSGLILEYLFEKFARINVEVEYASEFRYRNPVLSDRDLVLGISQSGETADTLAALQLAQENNCYTMAMLNTPHSTMDRLVDQSVYLNAGPEIGVASTKAFTNQVTAGIEMLIRYMHRTQPEIATELTRELLDLPSLLTKTLSNINVTEVSAQIKKYSSAIFLGRGMLFPIALEGALKLKEISYIHAEGYAAGEMKHGPIALIDNEMPIIALCSNDEHLPKMLSNIQEVKARKGIIFIVKSEDVVLPEGLADYVVEVPSSHSILAPLIMNLPLQMISYQVATLLGKNVDKPRNLAKSVTVE